MKKYFLLLISLIFLTGEVYCDTVLFCGYSRSKYHYDKYDTDTFSSFEVGLGVDGRYGWENKKMIWGMDILYLFNKDKVKFFNNYYKITPIYCDLYLKLKLLRYTSPYLLAGGSAGALFIQGTNSQWEKLDNYNVKSRFDYGVVFGCGIQYELFDTAFSVEVRYRLGLAKMKMSDAPIEFKRNSLEFLLKIHLLKFF